MRLMLANGEPSEPMKPVAARRLVDTALGQWISPHSTEYCPLCARSDASCQFAVMFEIERSFTPIKHDKEFYICDECLGSNPEFALLLLGVVT